LPDFGGYIQDLLREACALPGTLDIIRDEIVDLTRRDTITLLPPPVSAITSM
jgi:hypothetical protein